MTQSSVFIIELLEKIGVPFVGAVEAVSAEQPIADDGAAKVLAQMLGQAVHASIGLSESITMPTDESDADSARMALASLTGPIVADFYQRNKRLPEAADIDRIVKSLQAIIPFADNFSGATGQASRLALLGKETVLFDELQINLVMAQIMTPVINAIAEFPFGQTEVKLLQDVIAKLQNYATDLGKLSGDGSKLAEIMILKSLAEIYAHCHQAETNRLMQTDDATRVELSLDGVWTLFDKRLAMVELAAGVSDSMRGEVQSSGSVTPTPEIPAAPDAPVQPPAPPPTQETAQPVVPPPTDSAAANVSSCDSTLSVCPCYTGERWADVILWVKTRRR